MAHFHLRMKSLYFTGDLVKYDGMLNQYKFGIRESESEDLPRPFTAVRNKYIYYMISCFKMNECHACKTLFIY